MPLLYGVHKGLEDEANRLIRESLFGVTSMEAKKDILTPWKEQDRKNKEILVSGGVPDAAIRQGNYHRAWNRHQPHLNSRDCITPGRRYEVVAQDDNRADEFGDHDSWGE